MQYFLPATQCVVLTIFFLCTSVISDNKCTFKYGLSYQSANCGFQKNQCRWFNERTNSIKWERRDKIFLRNDYMYAPMSKASVNSTARLAGRWFRATSTSTTLRQYTLEFKYYIGQSNACQLAVFLETDEKPRSFTELFSTQRGTGEDFKSVSPIWLPYVDCRHRIVFEARKVSTGHCGYTGSEKYNEVEIDDIVFADKGLMTTTTSSVPPQSAATTGTSPSSMTAHTQTTHTRSLSTESFTTTEPTFRASTTSLTSGTPGVSQAPKTNEDGDADKKEPNIGLVTGISVLVVVVIIIAVVVVLVIVAVVVLLVFLRRRKTKSADNNGRVSSSNSGSIFNAAYTPDEAAVMTGHGTVHSLATNGTSTSASGQASESVGAGDLYSKPKKVRKNPHTPSNAVPSEGEEYNTLSQNNAPITPLDFSPSNTYDHLAQQPSGDQRGRDHAPQGNHGNDEDQYNALDRRHPPAPNSDPGAVSHADVEYSHLGDQAPLQTNQIPGAKNTPTSPDDDQYNVLARQNLTRPNQNAEVHEDVEYSHVNKQANPPSTGATHNAKSSQRKRAPEDYVNVALMQDEAGLQSKDTDDEYNALDFNTGVSQLAAAEAENLYNNTV